MIGVCHVMVMLCLGVREVSVAVVSDREELFLVYQCPVEACLLLVYPFLLRLFLLLDIYNI